MLRRNVVISQCRQQPVYTVTLQTLRENGACYYGYNKVVRMLQGLPFTEEDRYRTSYIHYQHDTPISLIDIVKNNGLGDALWCMEECISNCERDTRLLTVWCARQVQHLMTDQRSIKALDVAEAYANGKATREELEEAKKTAKAAYHAADFASAAYRAVYWAVNTVSAVDAYRAAYRAAYTLDVAVTAVNTAGSAYTPEAAEAARTAQLEMFIAMCQGRAPWQV